MAEEVTAEVWRSGVDSRHSKENPTVSLNSVSAGVCLNEVGVSVHRMMTTIMNMELNDSASLRWRKQLSKLDLRTDNVMNILGDIIDIFKETN